MDKHIGHASKEVIESRHGCTCRYAGVTRVIETGANGRVWEGDVETFELVGHEFAKLCFSWIVRNAEGSQRVTALSPPVKSPAWAVRVYLMREGRVLVKQE